MAFMHRLTRVLFEVRASDTYSLLFSRLEPRDEKTVLTKWLFILANLITLWQIRIKIVFPREDALLSYLAIQSNRRSNPQLNRKLINDRQASRLTSTDGTNVGIGIRAELIRAR